MLKKILWPLLALCTLLLRALAQTNPAWTEHYYSRGLFQGIRWTMDTLLGWLPFPAVYLLFGGLLWILGKGVHFLFFRRSLPLRRRLLGAGSTLIAFLCGTVVVFYWLWGYNYSRISIEEQLALPSVKPTVADLKNALEAQTIVVLGLRQQVQPDTSQPILATLSPDPMERQVRTALVRRLQSLGFPTPGRPRGRQPFWNGFLLRFGASGIYNPFTGECNIDQGLHFLTKPYNLAHEFCHGYGFADEGTCNFLAYLALEQSDQPLLRYSAELDYWRTLASAYRRSQPEVYAAFRKDLPSGFRADLEQIYQKLEQYPEFFEAFRYEVYDQYLKAQGIAEGMQNYSKVIPLIMAYRLKEKG